MSNYPQNHMNKCNNFNNFNNFNNSNVNNASNSNNANNGQHYRNNNVNSNQAGYLQEVTQYVNYIGFLQLLPANMSVKQAIEISIVADRLNIARVDAIKSWGFDKKGVIISAELIGNLLVSRGLIIKKGICIDWNKDVCVVSIINSYQAENNKLASQTIAEAKREELLDNAFCKANVVKATEDLALIRALRKIFPELLIGVISPSEATPSAFSFLKNIVVSGYQKVKGFINSCFTNDKAEKTNSQVVTKPLNTTKINASNTANQEEELYLDLDELETKSSKVTRHIN